MFNVLLMIINSVPASLVIRYFELRRYTQYILSLKISSFFMRPEIYDSYLKPKLHLPSAKERKVNSIFKNGGYCLIVPCELIQPISPPSCPYRFSQNTPLTNLSMHLIYPSTFHCPVDFALIQSGIPILCLFPVPFGKHTVVCSIHVTACPALGVPDLPSGPREQTSQFPRDTWDGSF